jgi:hypothetical protein
MTSGPEEGTVVAGEVPVGACPSHS